MTAQLRLLIVGWFCAVGAAHAQVPLAPQTAVPVPVHPSNPPPGADGPFELDYSALAPAGQMTGWYADVGVGLLKPSLNAHLNTPGPINANFANPTTPPTTSLNWTGVPEIGLGYRLGQAAGEVRVGYRLIASQGNGTEFNFDPSGNASVRTRLMGNVIDVDYILPEFLTPEGTDTSRWFRRELKAGLGIRTATLYFETTASGPRTLNSQATSLFAGLGPHTFIDLRQYIADRPAWLYARINAAGMFGGINQSFSQTSLNPDGSTSTGNFSTGRLSAGVGVAGFETGLSWNDAFGLRELRLTAAYGWERWWNVGRTDDSNAELTLQGIVLRCEYRY